MQGQHSLKININKLIQLLTVDKPHQRRADDDHIVSQMPHRCHSPSPVQRDSVQYYGGGRAVLTVDLRSCPREECSCMKEHKTFSSAAYF